MTDELIKDTQVDTQEAVNSVDNDTDAELDEVIIKEMPEQDFRLLLIDYMQDLDERIESLLTSMKLQLNEFADAMFELHRMLIMYLSLIEGIYALLVKNKAIDLDLVKKVQEDFVKLFSESFKAQFKEADIDATKGNT